LAAQVLGQRIAEILIRIHYSAVMKPWDPPNRDWYDGSGTNAYFEVFLGGNNPTFRPRVERVKKEYADGGIQVPDIISHKPDRKEYYEIKPDSAWGKDAGKAKLDNLKRFYSENGLPYKPGKEYGQFIPRDGEAIDEKVGGGVFKQIVKRFHEHLEKVMGELKNDCLPTIKLRWKLHQHGLITYRIGVAIPQAAKCTGLEHKAFKKFFLAAFMMAVDSSLWPEVTSRLTTIKKLDLPRELEPMRPFCEAQLREGLARGRTIPEDYVIVAEHDVKEYLRNRFFPGPYNTFGIHGLVQVTTSKLSKDEIVIIALLGLAILAAGLAEVGSGGTATPVVVGALGVAEQAAGAAAATGTLAATEGTIAATGGATTPVVVNALRMVSLSRIGGAGAAANDLGKAAAAVIAVYGTATLTAKEAHAASPPAGSNRLAGTSLETKARVPVFAPDRISTIQVYPRGGVASMPSSPGFGDKVEITQLLATFEGQLRKNPPVYYVGQVTVEMPDWPEDAETEI
jgi:hypothetical protein